MLLLPQPVVKSKEGEQVTRYMAFITHDKVGMAVMPMSGNPYHYMATIAHPGQVRVHYFIFDIQIGYLIQFQGII